MNVHEIIDNAVKLAKRGAGFVEPNPRVGAVVVKNGVIVGEGWHREYGGPHAEIMALAAAGEQARGADLYLTLEPCSTLGKTDPCTDAILATGIKRVFYAVVDPNPANGGKSREVLQSAGVECVLTPPHAEAEALIADFARYVGRTLPWVVMKWAMTADGKVATVAGDTRWISSEESRREGHEERRRSDAVVVGRATVKTDDPELTVRMGVEGRNPVRVIFDSGLHLDPASKVALSAAQTPTWVLHVAGADGARSAALEALGCRLIEVPKGTAGRLDPVEALRELRRRGLHRILVEGGPTVHGTLFENRLGDWVRIYVAPLIVGGMTAPGPVAGVGVATLEEALWLRDPRLRKVGKDGPDFVLDGRLSNHREG